MLGYVVKIYSNNTQSSVTVEVEYDRHWPQGESQKAVYFDTDKLKHFHTGSSKWARCEIAIAFTDIVIARRAGISGG
jgi:hypothetical protein